MAPKEEQQTLNKSKPEHFKLTRAVQQGVSTASKDGSRGDVCQAARCSDHFAGKAHSHQKCQEEPNRTWSTHDKNKQQERPPSDTDDQPETCRMSHVC